MAPDRANILIVDDQPDNLRTLSAILSGQGFRVRKALSGAMALETIQADPPDLILLDIRMPIMDGYQVCMLLKDAAPTQEIPVIFLTALSETTDKVKAFGVGGADYITKPFQAEEVLVRIQHQLTIQIQKQRLQQEIQERRNAETRIRQLNDQLEKLVQERTAQLQRSLKFESLLKRITDKVRDSLDENQILQVAVTELGNALKIECCRTEIFDSDLTISTVTHEYDLCPFSFTEYVIPINSAGLYQQLLQKQEIQFCEYQINPTSANFQQQTTLVCPIFDDHGLLGNLRLFKPPAATFDELESRLVRQVANQCAIAIRQARLYQKAQRQVDELKRLTQLKDDFLDTISHELRSPISSIKMVAQLLMAATVGEQGPLTAMVGVQREKKTLQYLQILQSECERELRLIQDLLDLQHLKAGVYPLERSTLNIGHWLEHIIEPFKNMAQNQQQILEVYFSSALPTLVIDGACLKRILTELLNNACKYTPPEGTITVTAMAVQVTPTPDPTEHFALADSPRVSPAQFARACPLPAAPANRSDTGPAYLLLSVINSGVEIPPEECGRIFDQFYRIPSNDPWKHGGTGLGLALVKRIVEHLSGCIYATSIAGQTCFTVELPIEVAIAPAASPSEANNLASHD